MTTRRIWVVVGSLALAAAACGGSGDAQSPATNAPSPATTGAPTTAAPAPTTAATTEAPTTTEAAPVTPPPTTEAPGAENGINSYREVQPAVVQIIATGTFRDPEIGYNTGAGSGSGFIISPDGYAVTNNHVVTGAATLKVYIGGDLNDSFNARVIGASECNDLALIKINEEDLPYLEWAEDKPTVGEEVYVAGFPLGDPQYTLVRGIVAKADADGETPWSSIDRVIQHDADAQPGNSGGPLVTEAGQVLGVHYASYNPGTGTTQKLAIAGDLAERVVLRELMNGDFESLGINGSAVWDEAAGISGVWVSAVKAGSPASTVGLKPGDIITHLNELPMGTDGTMQDYCDVIRTAGEGTPMAIRVLSWDDRAVYEGEINNPDRPLHTVATFGEDAEQTSESYSYNQVRDDTNELLVEIPSHWVYDGLPDGAKSSIWAAPDIQAFLQSWDTPGTKITVFPTEDTHTVAEMYDLLSATSFLSACGGYTGAQSYEDSRFLGILGEWTDCGSAGSGYVMLVTVDPTSARLVTMEFQYVTSADIEAANRALQTFNLTS
ncbi:MAG TPA: trypsin-like peptidase domain-containing protein [Ilumatobacter sp.]|nr:trypsin-like peptidase domain-containing protein [Ilumatobacter sp.]